MITHSIREDILKAEYRLEKHDEGGFFSEVYTSEAGMNGRALAGSIYYLLGAGESSRFHQIDCDEIWFYHEGCGMMITVLNPDGGKEQYLLGKNTEKGERAMVTVKKGSIFAARNLDENGYTFVSCMTVPKFSLDGSRIFSEDELLNLL